MEWGEDLSREAEKALGDTMGGFLLPDQMAVCN